MKGFACGSSFLAQIDSEGAVWLPSFSLFFTSVAALLLFGIDGNEHGTVDGIERGQLENHLKSECPMAFVNCGLCKKAVIRKDLRDHKTKECLERIVKCPFEKYGCKVGEITFALMKRHLKADVIKHLEAKSDYYAHRVKSHTFILHPIIQIM